MTPNGEVIRNNYGSSMLHIEYYEGKSKGTVFGGGVSHAMVLNGYINIDGVDGIMYIDSLTEKQHFMPYDIASKNASFVYDEKYSSWSNTYKTNP